jgi:hypothetical protein
VLSSEGREGTGLRMGEGGRVGTVVVVVTVVMAVAFCLDSLEGWSAYLMRFDRLCVVAEWTVVPSPVIDIAVESEPCCSLLAYVFPRLYDASYFRLQHRLWLMACLVLVSDRELLEALFERTRRQSGSHIGSGKVSRGFEITKQMSNIISWYLDAVHVNG